MKLKEIVKVTKDCIDRGVQLSSLNCPISEAIKDANLKSLGDYHICTSPSGINIGPTRLKVSHEVSQWIREFDSTGKGEPFTLCIDIEAKWASKIKGKPQ